MRVRMQSDVAALREEAGRIVKENTARLIGEAGNRMAGVYAIKVAEAEAILAGGEVDPAGLLAGEAARRGMTAAELASRVMEAASRERERLISIERNRQDHEDIVRTGNARQLRALIETLTGEQHRRRGLPAIGRDTAD